jgi:hypothetical protein
MAELRLAGLLLLAALATLASLPTLAQAQDGRPPPANQTPTELLFDAIAVGNADAVREAVARGANLNARNVLGQRPVDFAIDVGRSDIAFTLLSLMRAGEAPRPAALPPAAAPAPRAAPAGRAAPVAAPAPPRTAPLWANDGGAPQPDIGFLGFDASRPEGARPPAGLPRRGG